MAKLFYAVALLCLFTLSVARTPSENEDVTTAISLPISESTAAVRVRSEAANAETESDSAAVPLTRITFRPINRRFDVRSKRPCRHHSRFNNPRMKEIPYGNDMIVASGENSDFEDPVIHGGGRRTSGWWVRLHHHHHRHRDEDSDSDSDNEDDDRKKKMVFKRYDHGRFDTEKQLKALKEMRKRFRHESEEEEEKHKKGTGFMRRVRKFLDNYF
ncbi:hypothetical protein BUALT_Bualt10G0064100 [Buddleja alternifolia]|uniref:Uncharacterized protein n=1 Tax=Buddleja alternifolia TaxID=168488 RepID=A0AAV6WWI7_9LAMI|nr:hypothetical protein BUALT_Bualt10G0064100 [Buddleja alternifolia]